MWLVARWQWLGLVGLVTATGCATSVSPDSTISGNYFFVHIDGNDRAAGSSPARPLKTIQKALEKAYPGDTVVLLPGIYYQDFQSVRAGTQYAPIRIVGRPGTIVKGAGKTYVISLRHSFMELHNFTVDGLIDKNGNAGYRKKLVYIKGLKNIGIQGVRLLDMELKNAEDECLRLKYQAHDNEIAHSWIANCGQRDFRMGGGGHNGEAIYIGTAPEQIAKDVNPDREIDHSDRNWIHHNVIHSQGSECVDIKEGSRYNLIEYNLCTQQKDTNVAGISVRGNENIIRYNQVYNNLGAGIRLGGDTPSDGLDNEVYGNYLYNNESGGFKIVRLPQRKICGNTIIVKSKQKTIRLSEKVDPQQFLQPCR